jgi:hypothetical protein
MRLKAVLLTIVVAFVGATSAIGQLSTNDSALLANATQNAKTIFYQSLGDASPLYNGQQYAGYPFRFTEGHPFFSSDEPLNGSVFYDGIRFDNLPLQFDELQNTVLLMDPRHPIELINSKIAGFSLAGHQFTHLLNDTLNMNAPSEGFYEVLYAGPSTVYKKETKNKQEVIRSAEGVQYFIERKLRYYITKGNRYYAVNNRNDLADVLKEHKSELKAYARSKKLSAKHNWDEYLVSLTAYYDKLMQK